MRQSQITVSSEIQGGAPVFRETRVPIQIPFHYLATGQSVDHFIAQHPTVSRRQAVAILEELKERLVEAAG